MLLRCQKMWKKMRLIDVRPKNKLGRLIYYLILTILNIFEVYDRKLPLLLFEICKNKKNHLRCFRSKPFEGDIVMGAVIFFSYNTCNILSDLFELSRIDSRI